MKIFFFDIDGTLISTGGAGRVAMGQALEQTLNLSVDQIADPMTGLSEQVEGVPFSGRTDRAIARDLMRSIGAAEADLRWPAFRKKYLDLLPGALAACQGVVLPGVFELLSRLSAREDAFLSLLTGNLFEGAWLKLSHYGLAESFEWSADDFSDDKFHGVGGFGNHHFDRNDVARFALESARRKFPNLKTDDVWVIGDTPLDVACARAIDAKVIGVETGFAEPGSLKQSMPDVLVADLLALDENICWA